MNREEQIDISGFTKKDIDFLRENCNFTPQEREFFDLRNNHYTLEEAAEIMNISTRTSSRLSKKVSDKIRAVSYERMESYFNEWLKCGSNMANNCPFKNFLSTLQFICKGKGGLKDAISILTELRLSESIPTADAISAADAGQVSTVAEPVSTGGSAVSNAATASTADATPEWTSRGQPRCCQGEGCGLERRGDVLPES